MSRARNIANLVGGSVPALTRKYYDVVNAATSNKAEFTSVISTAKKIVIEYVNIRTDVQGSAGALAFLVSVGGSYINTGYDGSGYFFAGPSAVATGGEDRTAVGGGAGDNVRTYYWSTYDNTRRDGNFIVDLIDSTNYIYKISHTGVNYLNDDDTGGTGYSIATTTAIAFIDLNGPIDKVKIELDAAGAIDNGSAVAYYEV